MTALRAALEAQDTADAALRRALWLLAELEELREEGEVVELERQRQAVAAAEAAAQAARQHRAAIEATLDPWEVARAHAAHAAATMGAEPRAPLDDLGRP